MRSDEWVLGVRCWVLVCLPQHLEPSTRNPLFIPHSSLHGGGLVEQFAAVNDEVGFDGFVAARDAFDELFEPVELVAVCDALRFEVSAVAHAADEFRKREATL